MPSIPFVIKKEFNSERAYDIFSLLLEERIIFLGEDVSDTVANIIIAQLLYLEAEDPKKPVSFWINSRGGSVYDGMAIRDTMNFIQCPVHTIALGMAMSMAAILLASGEKGTRAALPNTGIMIHQPKSGVEGQVTDIQIRAKRLDQLKSRVTKMMSEMTGQPYDKAMDDMERDYWMYPEDALEYGIIDKIIDKRIVDSTLSS